MAAIKMRERSRTWSRPGFGRGRYNRSTVLAPAASNASFQNPSS